LWGLKKCIYVKYEAVETLSSVNGTCSDQVKESDSTYPNTLTCLGFDLFSLYVDSNVEFLSSVMLTNK